MSSGLRKFLGAVFGRTFSTSLGWTGCAFALLALFGLLHLLGWRDDTAIISGTLTEGYGNATIPRGVLYSLAYFGAVLVSPILLLATAVHAISARVWPGTKSATAPTATSTVPRQPNAQFPSIDEEPEHA